MLLSKFIQTGGTTYNVITHPVLNGTVPFLATLSPTGLSGGKNIPFCKIKTDVNAFMFESC